LNNCFNRISRTALLITLAFAVLPQAGLAEEPDDAEPVAEESDADDSGTDKWSPACSYTDSKGNMEDCSPLKMPSCLWSMWINVCMPVHPEDCYDYTCEMTGDFDVIELNLDGKAATREFFLRVPDYPNLGTAEHAYFDLIQAVDGECTTIFVGNGYSAILKAKSNGWHKIFTASATGGPFSYAGLFGWAGKQYAPLKELEDIPHDYVDKFLKEQGPIKMELPRR